jgi:hypothetical protein
MGKWCVHPDKLFFTGIYTFLLELADGDAALAGFDLGDSRGRSSPRTS